MKYEYFKREYYCKMPILSQLKGERGFISVSVSLQNSAFFHFSLSWCRAEESKENHRTIIVNVSCRLLQVWFHKKRSFTCSMLIHPNDLFTTLLSETRASGWGGWEGSSINGRMSTPPVYMHKCPWASDSSAAISVCLGVRVRVVIDLLSVLGFMSY